MVKKNKSTVPARIIFSVLFCTFAYITQDGLKSALIAATKVLSTVAYGSKNLFFARIMILCTSIIWLVYNLCVCSYAGALNEMLTIISIIIGIIRIDIPNLINKSRQQI